MRENIYYGLAILLGVAIGITGGLVIAQESTGQAFQQPEVEHQRRADRSEVADFAGRVTYSIPPYHVTRSTELEPSFSPAREAYTAGGILQWAREMPASSTWVPGGDVNRDEEVNAMDLAVVAQNWGRAPPNPRADINWDGVVDIYDLVGVGLNFGEGGQNE